MAISIHGTKAPFYDGNLNAAARRARSVPPLETNCGNASILKKELKSCVRVGSHLEFLPPQVSILIPFTYSSQCAVFI